jgi:hypothetical protein
VLALACILVGGCGHGGKHHTRSATVPRECVGNDSVPQPAEIAGVDAIRHCGPASATASIGGRRTIIHGGTCIRNPAGTALVLNVGTSSDDLDAPASARRKLDYVGLAIGPVDPAPVNSPPLPKGTSQNGPVALTVTVHGTAALVSQAHVELAPDGRSGSFRSTHPASPTVRGTFRCGKTPA